MRSSLPFISLALVALVGSSRDDGRETLAAATDACASGQVPVVWPLGETGFDPRQLYNSHGQFLKFTGDAYVHRGIDIAACVGDVVYASEAGRVVYVQYTPLDDANLVVVADSDEPDVGWQYQHLSEVFVKKGDSVLRDQALGTVAQYTAYAGFDHLHLQRMQPGTTSGDWNPSHADAGNPLSWLVARRDASAPQIQPIEATDTGTDQYFAIYDDGLSTSPAPTTIAGVAVDVVGNLMELFPGSGAPTCPGGACDKPVADGIMPMRLTFSVFRTQVIPSGAGGERTIVEGVFNNVIDLMPPIADEYAFADNVYRDGSVGDYSSRKFLVNLTHCPTTGVGSFTLSAKQSYLLQLVAEDASGNVAVRELAIDLP